ncbi:hypothetical protein [Neptunomonas concharum]|uniref:DUF8082 domain-containing protein n=1 Tax=Neptunomonas concharum TaxID=1031538 RepID=A0A5P1RDT3_9GAMM|nr:hypothetical protein [Neptunomonas concharum]QEQ97809.1 hypothetical protein F0U83_14365 [Neptunomonas concharum]
MNVLNDFQFLGGVRHVCVIREGGITGSTFPELLHDNLTAAARMMLQMLAGIQSLNEKHNEVHIEMDDSQLIGVQLSDNTLFVLMADREINHALINTAIRSARPALLKLESPTKASSSQDKTAAQTSVPPTLQPGTASNKASLKPLLKKIALVLADYVGPAATVLFQRTYTLWSQEGQPSHERLPQLTSKMAAFIENTDKRTQFLLRTTDLISDQSTGETTA